MKRIIVISLSLALAFSAWGRSIKDIKLTSPDGKLSVSIYLTDTISYSIKFKDRVILAPSHIGLELSDAKLLGRSPKLIRKDYSKHSEQIISPNYRFSTFNVEYNKLECVFADDYSVIFRAYNQGVA
jgi:alpha-glucosidase